MRSCSRSRIREAKSSPPELGADERSSTANGRSGISEQSASSRSRATSAFSAARADSSSRTLARAATSSAVTVGIPDRSAPVALSPAPSRAISCSFSAKTVSKASRSDCQRTRSFLNKSCWEAARTLHWLARFMFSSTALLSRCWNRPQMNFARSRPIPKKRMARTPTGSRLLRRKKEKSCIV